MTIINISLHPKLELDSDLYNLFQEGTTKKGAKWQFSLLLTASSEEFKP